MFQYFNADCFVELLVRAWERLAVRFRLAKWQAALLQQRQTVRIDFQAGPVIPRPDQGRTISARSTSNIEDRARGRKIGEDEMQHLDPRLQQRRPGAVNIFTMEHCALRWKKDLPVRSLLKRGGNETHGHRPNFIFGSVAAP